MFKTFDELDQEAGPGALFADNASKAPASPVGFDTPDQLAKAQAITTGTTFGAAFRQDNTIGSFLSRKDLGVDNHDDGTFNPVDYIKANGLEGHESSFYGVLNAPLADAKRDQIKMEQQDKETLDASGWLGTFAHVAAGGIDAPILIPGVVAVRGVGGAYSIGRSLLAGGASAAAAATVTEGALHATQETRTASESAVNIGGAAVLGSLLGGGVAALLKPAERAAGLKAIDNLADINSGKVSPALPEGQPASAGAMANPLDEFYVDPAAAPRTREELAVSGTGAGGVVRATSWFNPLLRATQRYTATAREIGARLYDSPVYRNMHDAGETTGPAVAAASRASYAGSMNAVAEAGETAFNAMVKSGTRMSRDDFYAEVGRAMRVEDQHSNPFIQQAAEGYRKEFDRHTQEAIKLGLLDPEDLDPKTAASYFSRSWNKDALNADQAKFVDVVGQHYAEKMAAEWKTDTANLDLVRAKHAQQLEDLSQTGPARGQRLEQIVKAGETLDARNPQHVDRYNDIRDQRLISLDKDATPEAKTAARTEIKRLTDEGGKEYQDYATTSAELRRRKRDLTERSPDAQTARGEKLAQRVADTQDRAERSMSVYGQRAKNLLNKLASDPAGSADELVSVTSRQVERLRAGVKEAETRAAEFKAQYLEHMNPQEGFDAAAGRAAREGATGDAAIKAGTKEADRITKQIADAQRAVKDLGSRADRLEELNARLGRRETARDAAQDLARELEQQTRDAAKTQAARSLRRGEELAALKERAAKMTPEEVAARGERTRSKLTGALDKAETSFANKWEVKRAIGLEKGESYDFQAAGRQTAQEIHDKLTGKEAQHESIPQNVTAITRGPLKERTFLARDSLFNGTGWLKDDAREVFRRYARSMTGEAELTRQFGRADMREQFTKMLDEHNELKMAVANANSTEELNNALGRDKFGKRANLEKAKLEAAKALDADYASAVKDTKAGRDSIRGTLYGAENSTTWASVVRSAMKINYIRISGGFALPNLGDLYRPAMVHGLMPFVGTLPDAMAAAFGKGTKGLGLLTKEAQMAGLLTEKIQHHMSAGGDLMDPFASNATNVERFLDKGARLASRWSLMSYMQDASHTVASTVSQHRILEAITGGAGKDGSFVRGDGQRLLRVLGVSADAERDMAELFARHGEVVDGYKVPNTEDWMRAATASGDPAEIAKASRAVRTYRAALNADVNSIISIKGVGDAPLFAEHPLGKMLTQFSGYTMGAHSRVMIRGMQEDKARFVGSLAAMSIFGAMTSYISAWRGGADRWEKFNQEVKDNPAKLIGEGLDRSSVFPLLFDFSNRIERASGAIGQDYKLNPLKAPFDLLAGKSPLGKTSSRGADTAGAIGAVAGPTFGALDSALAATRALADKSQGKAPTKHDLTQANAIIPFQAHIGVREMLQVLNGNSPWLRR